MLARNQLVELFDRFGVGQRMLVQELVTVNTSREVCLLPFRNYYLVTPVIDKTVYSANCFVIILVLYDTKSNFRNVELHFKLLQCRQHHES